MDQPSPKLAESLAVLHVLQDQGRVALRATDLTRTHIEPFACFLAGLVNRALGPVE